MISPGIGPADSPDERRLPGGRTSGAIRVGDTVRRPPTPGSIAVRTLLEYLADHGFDQAPRYLGLDEQGRDTLSYLDGETLGEPEVWPQWTWTDAILEQVADWLRQLHALTSRWQPPVELTWFTGRPWRAGLVIGHHDAAPWNAVVRDGQLVGFIDWDTAAPARPEQDLAWSALTWVPLLSRRVVSPRGYRAFDDRRRRLHLFLDHYGYSGDRSAFGAFVAECARTYAEVNRSVATGNPRQLAWATDLEHSAREIELLPPTFWTRGRPE